MAKKKTATAVTTVYIGKSLMGLPKYTVFKGGAMPDYVAKMVAEDPAIKGLIVPVTDLQEARKNMHVKGHILNYYMNKQMEG